MNEMNCRGARTSSICLKNDHLMLGSCLRKWPLSWSRTQNHDDKNFLYLLTAINVFIRNIIYVSGRIEI